MRLANMSNGLAFPHDGICYFQSQHAHRATTGYFGIDAMPIEAIIHLLKGGDLTIIDATRRHKTYTDAQKFGVPTFALVFNRALRIKNTVVCDWQTPEMAKIAKLDIHKPMVQKIRKLEKYYGNSGMVAVGWNIHLICKGNFHADDKPKRLKQMIHLANMNP